MFMPPVFPAHWHVSQPVLIADTFSSLVWKVSLPDGTPAIVKGLKPIEDVADELRGADYLVWRNGRGAVRLLGRENNLMLLEYAGERMLSHIVAEHGDYQATEIAAELMAKLYAASEEPLPSALLPIRGGVGRGQSNSHPSSRTPEGRSGIALQLCFSGRAMIKTQVVKLTTSTRRL